MPGAARASISSDAVRSVRSRAVSATDAAADSTGPAGGQAAASTRAFEVNRSKYFAHEVRVTACATATSWATIARLA